MLIATLLRPRLLIATAMALLIAGSAYGYAATNTVPDSKAGDGAGTVSGYTVSNIVYVLETTDSSKMDKVTFTLDATADTVKVQLVSGGTWYTADNGGTGNDWTVDPAAGTLTVEAVNTLRVVAHQ